MSRNKALIVVTSIVALIVVALAIFYFFFMRESPTGSGGISYPQGGDVTLPTDEDENEPGGTNTGGGSTFPDTTGFENQPKTFQALRQISSLPVAGATLLEKNAETIIRYVERGSGHIYQASATVTEAPKKISNTTIPKIYEALWNQKGEGLIIRYLKDDVIQTFYASLGASASSTGETELRGGTFLPVGISTITLSPSSERVFYINSSGGKTYGTAADPDGTSRTQRFQSIASEWAAVWGGENSILLFTKPSYAVRGIAYVLNVRSGTLTRLPGDKPGFTGILSPNASTLLYSESTGSGLTLNTLKINNFETPETLSIKTLPEKCLWSRLNEAVIFCAVSPTLPVGYYPDAWYQGSLAFTDQLIRLNTSTGETTILLKPEITAQRSMDIINLALNEKEDKILFMDKNDLSLWLLDLSQTEN